MKTLNEKKSQHRKAHPRDKISFGEQPVPKPVKEKKTQQTPVDAKALNTIELKKKAPSAVKKHVDVVKAKPPRTRSTIPADLMKCRKCGAVTTPHRVRIGDCHTNSYGTGWKGQTYSGANGRGRLYGI